MKSRAELGFTLVEVLVALTIFSCLIFTLFSSFNAFMASSQMIKERQGKELVLGMDIIISDLEQIFVLQPPQFQDPNLNKDTAEKQQRFQFLATEDQVEGQPVSILSFASLSSVQFFNSKDMPAGITRLTYYVTAHGNRMDLHRSDHPVPLLDGEAEQRECLDPVLFRDIQEFDLVFFDDEGNEHKAWDSQDEDFKFTLPVQVGIHIIYGKNAGEKKINTRVSIPVNRTMDK